MAGNGIKKEGFIFIADSAMVTWKNLEKIGDGIQFISRLPANYKECSNSILHMRLNPYPVSGL
jgi:transposase